MADHKFIRELNSLIRTNERKRLKAAPARAAITGQTGTGLAGEVVADDPPLPELVYILLTTGESTADVYSIDKDGGAAVFVASASGYIADLGVTTVDGVLNIYTGGLASELNDGDTAHAIRVAKNGTEIVSVPATNASLMYTTSDFIIYQTLDPPQVFNKYDINTGAYINTIASGSVTSIAISAANDSGLLYYESDGTTHGWSLKNLDGFYLFQQIGPSTTVAATKQLACSGKYMFLIPELTSAVSFPTGYQYTFHVYDNEGTFAASFVWDYNDLYAAGGGATSARWTLCTEDRFYVAGINGTNLTILTYELTTNITGGLITSCTRGALLNTTTFPAFNFNSNGAAGAIRLDAANFPTL